MLGDVEKKLAKELKPGTRVISHDYPLPSWKHVDVVVRLEEKIPISGTTRTVLLLYRVPARDTPLHRAAAPVRAAQGFHCALQRGDLAGLVRDFRFQLGR